MKHLSTFENFGHETYSASSTSYQDLNHRVSNVSESLASVQDTDSLIKSIQSVLTPDLLKGSWKDYDPNNPMKGQCYAASNALFWMLGGPDSGYTPYVISSRQDPDMFQPGESHWYLMNKQGNVLDPTKEQFDEPVKYAFGCANGMMRHPHGGCKRARTIMSRLEK